MSGMNAILPCILHSKEGKPAYTAQWSQGEDIILSYRKNRKPIVNLSPKWKDKIQWRANITDGDATITLLNVIKEHNGEYICKLRENSMPKNDIKIMLQILPKEEPKDPKGDNIDDAQGQGWLTTTPMIYFGHSSKVENINPTVPTQGKRMSWKWNKQQLLQCMRICCKYYYYPRRRRGNCIWIRLLTVYFITCKIEDFSR
uniref:Ig-like domain-containing protein n=1 Tax=Eptatretus burgeri TaxID=7764 RepID=A0A8C4PYD7_EPTBU